MSKFISLLTLTVAFALSTNVQAKSETLLKCAVNKVTRDQGARVDVIKTLKGEVKANVSFGSTGAAKAYTVSEIAPGIFQGAIKGKANQKYWIKLFVSGAAAENTAIRGGTSQLQVVYPNKFAKAGTSYFKSSDKENFVCGEQVKSFHR